jgi:NADPH:quinone reductase-like Zn-dependent oxidoreductase
MARRSKALWFLGGSAGIISALAYLLSYRSGCEELAPPAPGVASMRSIQQRCYGPPETLALAQVPKPVAEPGELLVKVEAAALNPLDWHYMRGEPYVMRLESGLGKPNVSSFGVDFAGVVESVGPEVSRFKPGDAVFGARSGALAEYLVIRESSGVVLRPANVTAEDAAGVPIAAITALQALRDKGQLRPGQKVLINGASGGVGTFAVQIAKSMGAEVTAVSSTRNLELVRSLGADAAIDYTREDFTAHTARYDLVIDNVGNHGLRSTCRALKPNGILVLVGAPSDGVWMGALSKFIATFFVAPFVSQQIKTILADGNARDLTELAALMQAGKLRTVIDRRYPLEQTPAAIAYLEEGRARGKVIVNIAAPSPAR